MDYLKAALDLKELIKHTNQTVLANIANGQFEPNLMLLRSNFGQEITTKLAAFTNANVLSTLSSYGDSEAFVMTDLVRQDKKEPRMTYVLYKGYHSLLEKGQVYFHLVDDTTLHPIGDLQYSNLEGNIFYKVVAPNFEESSCNAIETDANTAKHPSIVFLIGHLNEERLFYDIQRLVVESANNVQKHKNREFEFIFSISVFGGLPSASFKAKLSELEEFMAQFFYPVFPNCQFKFDLGE